ncbi:MAG TPA: tripartite tricarboxylate transporter TctB family protein [Hyphomicrobiaceae bacterium]|nr:tripartite tricarboxylate transporter TctB family protein [Hyphomicrobiaceae bacterium]
MSRSANLVGATTAAAAAVVLFALTFTFEQMPEGLTQGLGAELFPRLVLGAILVLSILLAMSPEQDAEPLPQVPPLVYASAASFAVFMALVWAIGMLAAMFAYLLGMGLLWGERRPVVLLASSGLVTLAVWAVFAHTFRIPLPHGHLLAVAAF